VPLAQAVPGGVTPLPRSDTGSSDVLQRIVDFRDLDPEQVKALICPMYAVLGPTVLSSFDTYRAPTTHDFIIQRIMPHVALIDVGNALELANDGNATLALPSFGDRLAARANNVLVDLQNQDRQAKVVDNHSMLLGSLMAPLGESVHFGELLMPQKLLAGESLRMDVRFLNSGVAGQLGANAQYGLVLIGTLIRVARS
jgi:hypothetical protein